MAITMRLLNSAERETVYTKYMTEAFPASELKPLAHIERMLADDNYLPYGFFEAGELVGYAYFVKTEEHRAVLLDYFAVLAEKRSHGYGSCFLEKIKEEIGREYGAILLETENPCYAHDEEDKKIREKRIQFYKRNGIRQTDVWARIVLDRYVIMIYETQKQMAREHLIAELANIYAVMFDRHANLSEKRNKNSVKLYKIYDGENVMQ